LEEGYGKPSLLVLCGETLTSIFQLLGQVAKKVGLRLALPRDRSPGLHHRERAYPVIGYAGNGISPPIARRRLRLAIYD
jgi:hypothetical protein